MSEPSRQRRKTLTNQMVVALPRRPKRYVQADPELRGHYVRVPPQGPCVFAAVARYHGKQIWTTIGTADVLTIEAARDQARAAIKRIKQGLSAFEAPPVQPDTVAAVCAGWFKRHVEAKELRTGDEMKRVIEKYVLPHWRDRPFTAIRRSDVATLLDAVEDKHGPWVADQVLTVLGSVASWYATRHDDYTPPFVRGMRRVTAQARNRSRILSDAELQQVWQAAEAAGVYGAFVLTLLLTSQRRDKVVTMKWSDLEGDVWTIASEPREKGNPGTLLLPPLAMKIIKARPRMASNPYVFPGHGAGPLSGYSNRHAAFKVLCNVEGWTLHDCRRTARSLMARAGVSSEHAERVLGHVIPGVEGVYNRHAYTNETADALRRLARLIEKIVDGEPDNVVPFVAQ
jgi:integrase